MKQKDLILIGVIIFISAVISYFISNAVFAPPKNRQQNVPVVKAITADFPQPDSRYFNANAFDPTVLINIGQNGNTNPFNASN